MMVREVTAGFPLSTELAGAWGAQADRHMHGSPSTFNKKAGPAGNRRLGWVPVPLAVTSPCLLLRVHSHGLSLPAASLGIPDTDPDPREACRIREKQNRTRVRARVLIERPVLRH